MNPKDYIEEEEPVTRPFDYKLDVNLVEDYMTGIRGLDYVLGADKQAMEFITLDYDITSTCSLVHDDRKKAVVLHLEVDSPAGRSVVASLCVLGVDSENNLWFAEHGGYITANNHLALRREIRRRLDEKFGKNFLQHLVQSIQDGQMPTIQEEGDWWKNGGKPPEN